MKRRTKVDQSLRERHGIVHLLKRVAEEAITIAEMEEIGTTLQKSGRRALSPLVRRLWREKKGDVISRYAYLLDFFEDDSWLDELIRMAVRRRDLEEEGKTAILGALEGCGVDVTAPPFSRLLEEIGAPLAARLPRLLDRGDEGLLVFVEEVLTQSPAGRGAIVAALPGVADPRVVLLLELLLGVEDDALRREVVAALGRTRSPAAARILAALDTRQENGLGALVERSRRRLAFLGIHAEEMPEATPFLPFHATCASPVDGAGDRVLWLARPTADGRLAAIYFQLHEHAGVQAVWGSSSLTAEECDKHQAALSCEEGAVPVPAGYAVRLLRDALHRSREQGTVLPPEFYVWRRYLAPEEVHPLPYVPEFPGYDRLRLAGAPWLGRGSETLLDDDCFAGWLLANHRVYDLAEEWLGLEQRHDGPQLAHGVEAIVKRFCHELLEPQLEQLQARLLLAADFMAQTGRERHLVARTLAVAENLVRPRGVAPYHPFLRRLALESLDLAREALGEGYDLRREDDAGEEWD
ncbi:MAG TPA: HEAT repeat domain-containing protein [Geobacteraceae bacterium]